MSITLDEAWALAQALSGLDHGNDYVVSEACEKLQALFPQFTFFYNPRMAYNPPLGPDNKQDGTKKVLYPHLLYIIVEPRA